MRKDDYLHARIEPSHTKKLQELMEATGLTQSEVIRQLLTNAHIAPVPMPVSYVTKEGDS